MKTTQSKQQKVQVDNLFQKGFALHQQNKLQEAKVIYEQILVLEPNYFNALQFLGLIFAQTNQFSKSVNFLSKALEIKPNDADCWTNYGNILQELKRFDEAITCYDKALCIKQDAEIYYNRGSALKKLKRFEESIASYDQAIRINPDAEIYYNRGVILQEMLRFEEAIASYDRAISIKPHYIEAYYNKGFASQELRLFDEALSCYNQVIDIKPDYAEAYNNRGNVLKELNCLEEANLSYAQALSIKLDFAEAHHNRGIVLQELKRFEEALVSYDKAISIKQDFVGAYNNRGNVLKELNYLDDALASYAQAINIKPNYVEAHYNQGLTLQDLRLYDEAVASYENTFNINPDYKFIIGFIQNSKMLTSNWENFYTTNSLILQKIDSNETVALPFPLLSIIDTLSRHQICAEIYLQDKFPQNNKFGAIPKRLKKNKIRLGYYSADFHKHPVSFLTAELFEIHNKDKFEIIAFSLGSDVKDEMYDRLFKAFNQFINVRNKTDEEVALLSRTLEIDIAIDLCGYTSKSRTGIFAFRAAPIQINYLGYPGTMGANYIDYIIADQTLIPAKSNKFYSEKIIYLPNSYQANDRTRLISDKEFTKATLGLPEGAFVFACFNNNYKITPYIFDSWMRILNTIEGSVLWLAENHISAVTNLKKEAHSRGIEVNRLIFAKQMPSYADYLGRYRAADLFLDTFPFSAHTIASDALWGGLPLLTMIGESFASRVAASLLNAINLPELITTNQEEYEALAIELASNPNKLKVIRDKLGRNRLTTPLFDTPRFTKHIEEAYATVYERYHADLPSDHIYIEEHPKSH